MKKAKIKEANYENIYVDCPYCYKELIFNRISDLKSIMPITRKELKCQNKDCGRVFIVFGDRVTSSRYRWFLDDLDSLKNQKKYGLYVIALCQACEMFMHQAIINKLIDANPIYRDEDGYFKFTYNTKKTENGVDEIGIYEKFCNKKECEITNNGLDRHKKYMELTFFGLMELFLYVFKNAKNNKLPTLKKMKKDKRLESFSMFENTDIHQIRNKVIHKNGYRPSLNDIEKYDKLISSIYWLSTYLDVHDSLYFLNNKQNYYRYIQNNL